MKKTCNNCKYKDGPCLDCVTDGQQEHWVLEDSKKGYTPIIECFRAHYPSVCGNAGDEVCENYSFCESIEKMFEEKEISKREQDENISSM